jgi:predicted GIY-YIG superfamily endonuclease
MAWVYILQGTSRRYYIGCTETLERRLEEHQRGSCHTTKRLGLPLELIVSRSVSGMPDALSLERKLKNFKNGAKAAAFLHSFQSSPD